MRRLIPALLLGLLAPACDDPEPAEPAPDAMPAPAPDATPDALADPTPDAAPDATPDMAPAPPDAAPDAGPAPARCSAPPPTPLRPDGPLPDVVPAAAGIDPLEAEAWATLRAGLLDDPTVHFVATYAHADAAYIIEGGPPEARARLVVRRVDHPDHTALEVVEGDVAAVFPDTDPTRHGDYAALLDAMENPAGVEIPDRGYAPDDPRVGWLPLDAQSWPDPLLRLTTAFDAADAPDAIVDLWPWAHGGTGRHGGLGLLQSQASFVLSGKGARRGVVLDTPARLVDVAPTALAALGIPTTGGVGPDGTYADGLYLTRQDGVVRWEALDPDPCVRPKHVVMVLFDGLLAAELNHLMLADDPPIELPTFRLMAREGAVFRHGAVVGYPSYSAPGHTTAGTGAWPGHHGVVDNAFYGRLEGEVINPFSVLQDLPSYFAEPERFYALYARIVSGDVETVSEAVHRALGPDAFTAVFNEITIGGADYDPLHFFGVVPKATLGETDAADNLGELMLKGVLGDRARYPVPALAQISFLSTDVAGERAGPHSALLRETLARIDTRMAVIREAYAMRGALDDTLFVLTSDHGMELVDPSRRGGLRATIRETGVRTRYVASGGGIWLATLALTAEATPAADAIDVTVTAHDDGRPVEGATVRCEGCPDGIEAITDAAGRARLPTAAADAITASHPGFNPQRMPWGG